LFLLFLFLSYQVKGQYDFTVSATEGCSPLPVKFTYVTTATVDSVDTYYWSFGNGITSYSKIPDTTIFIQGVYDPTLILTFLNGSEVWIVKADLITVDSPPAEADFTYSRPTESFFFYQFESTTVLDTAAHDYTFAWDIEDFAPRVGESQDITFPSVDTFTVMLTVTDENGCSSSTTEDVVIIEEIVIPNVFTPGGDDDINNYFIIQSNGGIVLRIRIYSRTGVLVYEMEGPVIAWNGETASGDKLKTGVYFYSLEAVSGDPGKIYSKTGFLHMYRKD
jgi:gliding motility-associated-like protein